MYAKTSKQHKCAMKHFEYPNIVLKQKSQLNFDELFNKQLQITITSEEASNTTTNTNNSTHIV